MLKLILYAVRARDNGDTGRRSPTRSFPIWHTKFATTLLRQWRAKVQRKNMDDSIDFNIIKNRDTGQYRDTAEMRVYMPVHCPTRMTSEKQEMQFNVQVLHRVLHSRRGSSSQDGCP